MLAKESPYFRGSQFLYKMRGRFLLIGILFFVWACGPKPSRNDYAPRSLHFADREWWVKTGPEKQGPGDNLFYFRNAYVDWLGQLHLKIKRRRGNWTCAEVFSKDRMGYGRYQMTVKAELGDLDPNLVFGFFTWSPSSFESQANSEIDIEFSRWGYPLAPRVLHYSVHPVSLQKLFLERFQSSNSNPKNWNGLSTHVIEWRDTSVSFFSYQGAHTKQPPLESFHYSFNNPPRKKGKEGQHSAAITVPKPGKDSQVRMNFWIFGEADAPLNQKGTELIIKDFRFEAY